MRILTPQAANQLAIRCGNEPIFILGVQWTPNGNEILYCDHHLDIVSVESKILQLSDLDTALKFTSESDAQQISVILSDIDGSLKQIIDTFNIYQRPCNLYLYLNTLTIADKILLFSGYVSGPVTWDEGSRTLEFSIATQLNSVEAGFSIEEGNFPAIPSDALGKAWPLIFGTVCHAPTAQLRSPRVGYLLQGEGLHDFTLEARICQAQYIVCPAAWETKNYTTEAPATFADRFIDGNVITYGDDGSISSIAIPSVDAGCAESRYQIICELKDLLAQQKAYERPFLLISNGDQFPQGQTLTLDIDGAKFTGYFQGNQFTIISRKHPDYDSVTLQACVPTTSSSVEFTCTHSQDGRKWSSLNGDYANEDGVIPIYYYEAYSANFDCDAPCFTNKKIIDIPAYSRQIYEDMPTSDFVWLPQGTEVFIEGESELLYIVSLLPGVVNNVSAYKTLPDGSVRLMTVPAAYYQIYETDYQGYNVVEIGLPKALSRIDEDFEDELYVSFTSTVGPNPVDIIEWLLATYLPTLTTDTTSFAYVKAKLANYPCNFWLLDRKDTLELIKDIAYQSRCAFYIRNSVAYLKYLSEEPTSVAILTASDILPNSFKITITDFENLVTKSVIKWQQNGAETNENDSPERTLILKHNIQLYGTHADSINYYTQTTYETILKSATFWLIRNSNAWKQITFDTPLHTLKLDIFDCVTIDLDSFNSASVKVIITGIQYNIGSNTIHYTCATPIRVGETTQYQFYWPANLEAVVQFPATPQQQMGYDFEVTPPIGHILAGGETSNTDFVTVSAGDMYPSDTGDVAPTITCFSTDIIIIENPDPVISKLEWLGENATQGKDNKPVTGNTPAAAKSSKVGCGLRAGAGCLWTVTICTVTPVMVGDTKDGVGCTTDTSVEGGVCCGIHRCCCYEFDDHGKAIEFRDRYNKTKEGMPSAQQLKVGVGYIESVSGVSEHKNGAGLPKETDPCGIARGEGMMPSALRSGLPIDALVAAESDCMCVYSCLPVSYDC